MIRETLLKPVLLRTLLGLASLLALSGTSRAQPERELIKQTHFWWSVNSSIRLTNRLGAVADVHIRRENGIKDPNFYFLRFGMAYWLDDEFSLTGGYAHLWLANDTEAGLRFANENRIYQQVLWRKLFGSRSTILGRIRTEQRWQEVLNMTDGEGDRIRFSNRLRFLVSATIPFFENRYLPALAMANEVLVHFGKETVYNTFDQNRIFLGLRQRVTGNLTFDIGYMLVYQQRYSGYQYNFNNTFRFFFYYSPDFRKDRDILHYPVTGGE